MNLVFAIQYKYPTANSQRDFRVEDDGEGPYISLWNLSESPPTDEELATWWLEYKREEKRQEMSMKCNLAILGNFTSATTGHTYEFAEYDQANFTQQMLLLVSNPALIDVSWKTVDAGIVSHTREQFFGVIEDANIHKRNNLNKFWTKEAQLKTFTTLQEIENLMWDDIA